MDHREDITIRQTTTPIVPDFGAPVGLVGASHVKEEGHMKVKDTVTGLTRQVDFERKVDESGGKTDYHLREDGGVAGLGRKVDYTRKDDMANGTHKVDYKVREGEEEGFFDKMGKKLGLKN